MAGKDLAALLCSWREQLDQHDRGSNALSADEAGQLSACADELDAVLARVEVDTSITIEPGRVSQSSLESLAALKSLKFAPEEVMRSESRTSPLQASSSGISSVLGGVTHPPTNTSDPRRGAVPRLLSDDVVSLGKHCAVWLTGDPYSTADVTNCVQAFMAIEECLRLEQEQMSCPRCGKIVGQRRAWSGLEVVQCQYCYRHADLVRRLRGIGPKSSLAEVLEAVRPPAPEVPK